LKNTPIYLKQPLQDDDDDDDDDDDGDEYGNFYSAITQHMPLQGRLDKDHATCQRYVLSK